MKVWVIHMYRHGGYIGLVVPWAFKDVEAAQWYVANECPNGNGWEHEVQALSVYSLAEVQAPREDDTREG